MVGKLRTEVLGHTDEKVTDGVYTTSGASGWLGPWAISIR
jgi:hypothetical protein